MFPDGLLHLRACSSTQDVARAWRGTEWGIVWSDRQSEGRGRHGRDWVSRPGGLYCTVCYPSHAFDVPLPMQLMGAAALWIQVIQETAGLTEKLALKWPNDLLCGDRKLGGFLGETRDSTVLLGMGINVNNPVSDLEGTFRYPPVSLRDVTGRHFSRRRLLLAWWRHWRGGAEATNHGGLFDPADLEQKLTTLGKRVSVKDAEGRAVSLAPDGGLRLEVGGEVRTVYAGEAVETRVS